MFELRLSNFNILNFANADKQISSEGSTNTLKRKMKPGEKRIRVPSSPGNEEEAETHVDDTILHNILDKLKKLDILDHIYERLTTIESDSKKLKETVSQIEGGLNTIKLDVQETKTLAEQKADKARDEALEKEVEELRNRSRRNNLVFYNVPEKTEEKDCISFIQDLIATHMGLETLCGHVDIERTHRTPTRRPNDSSGKQGPPRPIHVSFLRYTDKMKVISNAAARLKDSPLNGKLIGIS